MDPSIVKTSAEIYIPSRALAYGTYELRLTVTMGSATHLFSTAWAYVKITPSDITPNLVPYGTSMITRGHAQNLTLDPGTYSDDRDGNVFNASVSEELQRETFSSIHSPTFIGLELSVLLSNLWCVALSEHQWLAVGHR